jgi:hypothetical protein
VLVPFLRYVVVLIVSAALAAAPAAPARGAALQVTAGGGITLPDRDLEAGTRPAAHVAFLLAPVARHALVPEARLGYSRTGGATGGELAMTDVALNVTWTDPREPGTRPFLSAGTGIMRLRLAHAPAFNVGAGVTRPLFARSSLRVECRYVTFEIPAGGRSGWAANWEFVAGVSLRPAVAPRVVSRQASAARAATRESASR